MSLPPFKFGAPPHLIVSFRQGLMLHLTEDTSPWTRVDASARERLNAIICQQPAVFGHWSIPHELLDTFRDVLALWLAEAHHVPGFSGTPSRIGLEEFVLITLDAAHAEAAKSVIDHLGTLAAPPG